VLEGLKAEVLAEYEKQIPVAGWAARGGGPRGAVLRREESSYITGRYCDTGGWF